MPCLRSELVQPFTPLDPEQAETADLDGDGDLDLVVVASGNGWVAWFENVGGELGPVQVIDPEAVDARDLVVHDVDGDGRLDLVVAMRDRLVWYAQQGPLDFAPPHLIDSGMTNARGLAVADVDGDGLDDMVVGASTAGTVRWSPGLGGGSFGPATVLVANVPEVQDLAVADLDGDGDLDLVTANYSDDALVLHDNVGGSLATPVRLVELLDPREVLLRDLDGDGDLDLVGAGRETLWLENHGTAWGTPTPLTDEYALDVAAADLDDDGDLDVLLSSYGQLAWLENQGGAFAPAVPIREATGPRDVATAADLDGDGLTELLVGFPTSFVRYDGTSPGRFEGPTVVAQAADLGPVVAADLDADGDDDLLLASHHGLVAYVRDAGLWSTVAIDAAPDIIDVAVGDVDADGLPDVVFAQWTVPAIAWARNLGGTFGPAQTIDGRSAWRMALEDLDRDGDADLVIADGSTEPVRLDNVGGTFAPAAPLDVGELAVTDVHGADLDGDGWPELLFAAPAAGVTGWLPNVQGVLGAVANENRAQASPVAIRTFDADADGDLDVVSAGSGDGPLGAVAWYRNDAMTWDVAESIYGDGYDYAYDVHPVDLDGDALPEVAFTQAIPDYFFGGTIYELWVAGNLGTGFDAPQLLRVGFGLEPLRLTHADIDSDGVDDLVVSYNDALRVWVTCAPEPPTETGHTGIVDTGTVDTGTTPTPGPTGPATDPSTLATHAGTADEPAGCGCSSRAPVAGIGALLVLLAAAQRRR